MIAKRIEVPALRASEHFVFSFHALTDVAIEYRPHDPKARNRSSLSKLVGSSSRVYFRESGL